MFTDPPVQVDTDRRISLPSILGVVLGILLCVVAIYAIRMSDPYVRDVLHLNGSTANGQAIFQMNCAGCHGDFGVGKVGPSLEHVSSRKTKIGMIRQITTGKTPPMPKFQASPSEMADLLSYLNTL